MLKALKIIRIFRLWLRRLLKVYELEFFETFQKIKRYALFFFIGTISHWLACGWNFIGTFEDETGQPQGWVIEYISGRHPTKI